MKIRMLQDQQGSIDGVRVSAYENGKEYDLSDTAGAEDLAAAFVAAGFAEPADAPKVAKPAKSAAKHETK